MSYPHDYAWQAERDAEQHELRLLEQDAAEDFYAEQAAYMQQLEAEGKAPCVLCGAPHPTEALDIYARCDHCAITHPHYPHII